jgi:hypothetical protein
MFKPLSIFAALITFGTGSVSAQQREALLQTIEVPGADFDIALATPKTPARPSTLVSRLTPSSYI